MTEDLYENARKAVAAATGSYGGPVSDEQLAKVYLPEGQDTVDTGPTGDESPSADEGESLAADESGRSEPLSGVAPPAVEAPD